jgi:hypothetical protein
MFTNFQSAYFEFKEASSAIIDMAEGIGETLSPNELEFAIKLAKKAHDFLSDFASMNAMTLSEFIEAADNSRIDIFEDSINTFNEELEEQNND